MTGRRPSPEERELWRAATRDVAPRPSAPSAAAAAPAPAAPAPVETKAPARLGRGAPETGTGLDRRSAQRLHRGQMPIEARLDLHGMTQAEAHAALLGFLARAQEQGVRAVLVITGKGGARSEGVLRRAVPLWLGEPSCRGRVLAATAARPKHGGEGALYVLLRRRRAAI